MMIIGPRRSSASRSIVRPSGWGTRFPGARDKHAHVAHCPLNGTISPSCFQEIIPIAPGPRTHNEDMVPFLYVGPLDRPRGPGVPCGPLPLPLLTDGGSRMGSAQDSAPDPSRAASSGCPPTVRACASPSRLGHRAPGCLHPQADPSRILPGPENPQGRLCGFRIARRADRACFPNGMGILGQPLVTALGAAAEAPPEIGRDRKTVSW